MHNGQVHSVVELIALPILDFVNESYRLLLNRTPDPLEQAERAGALRAGLGRTRFLADMARSAEFRQRQKQILHDDDDAVFVHTVFRRYLGRTPESEGLDHYVGLLARGKSRLRLMRDVARSREARLKRTFWYEMDHLIATDRAERHWLRRWFGRSTRQRRLHNQKYEALLQHRPAAIVHGNGPVPSGSHVRWHVDPRNQGHYTSRAMARLQHAAGNH